MFILALFSALLAFSGAKNLPNCTDKTLSPQICIKIGKEPRDFFDIQPNIEVIDIYNVDQYDKTMTLFFYMKIEWYDEAYGITGPEGMISSQMQVPLEQMDLVGRPDIMFMNAFEIERVPMFGQHNFNYFWLYTWDESILEYAEYVKLKIGCDFNFEHFPFDQHECSLKFLSISNDHYMLNFSVPILSQGEDIGKLSYDMALSRVPFEAQIEPITTIETTSIMGYRYNVAGIKFYLKRSEIALMFAGFFFPSGLFASFAILALFIKVGNITDRMTVLMQSCLIFITLYVTVSAPPDRGMSYIEIWSIGMMVLVIVTILETSFILLKMRGLPKAKDSDVIMCDIVTAILLVTYFVLFQIGFWYSALLPF